MARLDLEELMEEAAANVVADLLRQRLIKEIAVADPGAGLEWSATVPPGVTWDLLGVSALLLTSAVVANRFPSLTVQDQDGVFLGRFGASLSTAASTFARTASWQGLGAVSVNAAAAFSPLPSPFTVLPGWKITSLTSAMDVGDAYTGIRLVVREWTLDGIRVASEWAERHLR